MKIPIKGYEKQYAIDSSGIVYSTPLDGKPARELKQEIVSRSNTTYRRVTLCKDGVTKRFQVHRLVADHFLPNLNNLPIINHIDNDGSNNHVSNLEWCTQKENIAHSKKQGRHISNNPEACSKAAELFRQTRTADTKVKYDEYIGQTFKNRLLLKIISYGKHPQGTFKCLICSQEFNAQIADSIKPKYPDALLGCRSCSLKHARRKDIV